MCGICGFTGTNGKDILISMTNAVIHRGPDEDGYYSNGKINLGFRRLSIIDVETGHQPVHNEDNSIWAIFNGEIYNFLELREDLGKNGHRFYTDHSDSEVLVHLYEDYGHNFVNLLNGMFAIALWDGRKEELLLIRDRMGVKPIFYALINGNIVFGSEIKSILAHPDYTRSPNLESLSHYLTFKNIPAPFTAFKDINSLLPGEMLFYSRENIKKNKWWTISFKENEHYREEEVKERIIELLVDSTRLRMRCDVPFGAYLSGGMDSSTIVAIMARFTDNPIKTFCLGYEDDLKHKEADLYFARKVSSLYGTEHHEYIMSHQELMDDIEDVIKSFDQPFSGTISTFFLSKLIKKHVKVALSGDGADELFGSYLTHRTAQPIYYYNLLYNKIKSGQLNEDEKKLLAPCDMDYLDKLFKVSYGNEAKWKYNLCLFTDNEKENLFNGEIKNSFKLLKKQFNKLTARNPLNRILEMEWNTQIPDQVLAFVDFLSMAHSVEVRSPFLDYRLVEFVATISGKMKIKDGNVKDILKKAVEPLLPEGITRRKKEGFVLPIYDWMAVKMVDFCKEVLSEKNLNKHDILNFHETKVILDNYISGNRRLAGKVWNLMMLQLWLKNYFG